MVVVAQERTLSTREAASVAANYKFHRGNDLESTAASLVPENRLETSVLLTDLWEKTTGGSDVAARPGAHGTANWPRAPRPAGVEEAVNWFLEHIETSTTPSFLFLVGGPGAGKSHTTSEIVRRFRENNPREDGLAHRTYSYDTGDRGLVLINDATIASDAYQTAPLIHDIGEAVSSGNHFIACVNRGVLVEELAQARAGTALQATPGNLICEWLHSAQGGADRESGWELKTSTARIGASYVASGVISNFSKAAANIVVVYLDLCSLLERRPVTQLSRVDRFPVSGKYEVAKFSERSSIPTTDIPAGVLLSGVIESLHDARTQTRLPENLDPIAANVRSLSNPIIQKGLLSVLRAAEIASSQRFTYREIWGAITRSIVGPLASDILREDLSSRLQMDAPSENQDVMSRFRSLQKLADLRFCQALFGSPTQTDAGSNQDAITRLTHTVDPLLDSLPGDFPTNPVEGWSTPISSALSGPSAVGTPLGGLLHEIDPDDPFHAVLTEFDHLIDQTYSKCMRDPDLSDKDRTAFVSWYGRYLTRLYAVANGIPGFVREIEAWTQAWSLSPILPQADHIDLQTSLETLLRPRRESLDLNSQTLIPVFESRTEPIVGWSPRPRVAVALEKVKFTTTTLGDAISLEVGSPGTASASIELDFGLIREALACSGHQSGITEVSDTAVPRLERLRASDLVPNPAARPEYRIVHNDTEYAFAVKVDL